MAGDWIKMRTNLTNDPAVVAVAAELGMDEFAVVGRLHALWAWADQHTVDGCAVGATEAFINRYTSATGFAQALINAGWLVVDEGGITIPRFDRHNGKSAKQRALAKNRMQASRCAASVTNAQPEKRREEKSISTKPAAVSWSSTDGFTVPDTQRDAWATAYPGVDIDAELRKAHAWLASNPEKSHRKQWGRFLNNWLGKASPTKPAATVPAKSRGAMSWS